MDRVVAVPVNDPQKDDRLLLEGPQPRWREIQLLARAGTDFIRGFRGCTSSGRAWRCSARRVLVSPIRITRSRGKLAGG